MSTCEWLRRYNLVYPKGATAGSPGCWLATIVLTHDGYFFAESDFGGYAHHWHSPGADFREALLRFKDGYVLSKIAEETEYDGAATLKRLRDRIDEGLVDGDMTAKEHADEVERIGWHGDLSDLPGFWGWYQDTELGDASEVAVYDYPRDARLFVMHVLPALRAAIEDELASERAAKDGGK